MERSRGCGHDTHLGQRRRGVGLAVFTWFIILLVSSIVSKTMHLHKTSTDLLEFAAHALCFGGGGADATSDKSVMMNGEEKSQC